MSKVTSAVRVTLTYPAASRIVKETDIEAWVDAVEEQNPSVYWVIKTVRDSGGIHRWALLRQLYRSTADQLRTIHWLYTFAKGLRVELLVQAYMDSAARTEEICLYVNVLGEAVVVAPQEPAVTSPKRRMKMRGQ